MTTRDKVVAMLLGTGIGDGLGRVVEGWTHEDVRSSYGRITNYIVPEGWPVGRKAGICTDDEQITRAVAEGLLSSGGKPDMDAQVQAHVRAFQESTQGWGPTTYGAVRRLTQGVPWRLAGARGGRISGVGNGCPMRISPASLLLVQGKSGAIDFITSLCSMTHQTSVAVSAGLAHAFGLAYCLQVEPVTFNAADFVKVVIDASKLGKNYFADTLTEDDITERLALCHHYTDWPPARCMAEMENGRSYVYCSLPFSYMLFLRNPRSIESLYDVVSSSVDSDTNGSMVGALLGAVNGSGIFPNHLVDGLEAAERLVETANRLCDVYGITDRGAKPVRRLLYVTQADVVQPVGDNFVISEFLLGGILAQVANSRHRYITGTAVTASNAAALADAIGQIEQTQAWELASAMNGATKVGITSFGAWLRLGAFEMVEDRENVTEKT